MDIDVELFPESYQRGENTHFDHRSRLIIPIIPSSVSAVRGIHLAIQATMLGSNIRLISFSFFFKRGRLPIYENCHAMLLNKEVQ